MSTPSKLIRLALLALPLLGTAVPAVANVRSANSSTVCQWETEVARRGFRVDRDANFNQTIRTPFEARYSPLNGMYHLNGEDDGSVDHPITCNIPRNLPLRTDGMSDLEVRFRAAATNIDGGSYNVTCTAYSYRSDGTLAVAATRTVAVSVASTGGPTTSLDFGGAISASGSKGYYVLTCNMPRYVALHSIYSSENDGVANN
jgi:hypothetical protein